MVGLADARVGEGFRPGDITATILGGRWDGTEVCYAGTVVDYRDDTYVALRNGAGRVFYLIASAAEEWFE